MAMRISVAASILILILSQAALAVPAEVMVTVNVRTTDGKPIAGSYVGLVPVWRPSSRPLVEEIAEKGVSVLRVPAGAYQVIAGARGFQLDAQRLVEITEKSGRTVDLALAALTPVTGTLRDGEGRPIGGGRVATVNGAIPAPLGRLSKLAVQHLTADWSATTDARGAWKLMLPDGIVPLLFEARGRAAEWRTVTTPAVSAVDGSLARGSMLTVTTDRVDPNLIVTLSREDDAKQSAVLKDDQVRVSARWATTRSLTWDSLPPGTYGIYAKYPAPRYFMQSAVKVATITLAPGDRRTAAVILPGAKREVASAAALFLRGLSRIDLGTELSAFGRDAAGQPRRLEHFVEEVIAGSVLHVQTDGIRPPLYATTEDRFFSTTPDLAEVVLDADAEPYLAVVHPRVDAHFSVRFAEEDLQPPRTGIAVLRDCSNARRVTTPIAITNNVGELTGPAGCQSIVLELDPFEPVVRDVVLPPGEQSMDDVVLRGAGSADVRVVREPGGGFVPGATVRAISVDSARAIVVREVTTDERGWASLAGLPSSSKLQLVAETPDGAMSAAAEVRLAPRERTLVDPLAVPEPATLIVVAKVDEAFLARFPAARVVTVMARPADPERTSEQRQQHTVQSNPETRFDRLRPGRWLVNGVVSAGGTYSPFDIADVELKAGEERRVEAMIEPNVFDGVVTSGGTGLAAKVMIEDRGRVLYFNTDPTGAFRATLQERGTYRVAVARLSAQGNIIPIGDVAFTDPGRRIEIAVPAGGSVTVRVRRADRPVPAAVVWISRRDTTGRVEQLTNRGGTTNDAGETSFEDLVPGAWTFSIRDTAERRGAENTVVVESGKKLVVDLDLTPTAAIEGTLRDLGGTPVPRARVECLFAGPGGSPDLATADSDAEGAFAIALIRPAPPSALCSVVGSMGTVDAFRATPGQRVQLSVRGAAGQLRIADWPRYRNPDALWLVAQDGRAIGMRTVSAKLGQFGAPLTIPALAAGVWRIVRVDSSPQWRALMNGMGWSLPAVAEITLRAGTTETMHLNEGEP